MEKVLVHDDDNEDIHYIERPFLSEDRTLCGQRLNYLSTIRVKKLDVTCKKCLKIAEKAKKKHIEELNCAFHANHSLVKMHDKINELVKAVNQLLENK